MAPKKISRKQLLKEPDEFITTSARIMQFAAAHKIKIIWAAAVFFGGILTVAGVHYFSNRAEVKAYALLNAAQTRYAQDLEAGDAAAARETSKALFLRLIQDYPNRSAGKLARIIFADICFQTGDADQAIVHYEGAVADFVGDPLITSRIYMGLGYAHDQQDHLPEAIRYFKMIVDGPDFIMKDEALFHLGRLYARSGQAAQSEAAFQRIVDEYEDSTFAAVARDKVAAGPVAANPS
jgi:tetratricopeptide (TPR) repeat protein